MENRKEREREREGEREGESEREKQRQYLCDGLRESLFPIVELEKLDRCQNLTHKPNTT
jgi:hypothetical protein